ncbi:sulfatase [Rufibacter ruber]|uniref:sulfatase n=1 Tax=Rufibacter ruber TaxID=1783499 RepID=UPI0008330413|nr:sulfatase [Rufibacter ruber]
MRKILSVLFFIFAALSAPAQSKKTNIILILADDLGLTDLGCYGSSFYETPNLDKLAASGMRFTNAYSACTVCSPTRAALMTGKSPARLHLTDWIAGQNMPYAKLQVPDWTMFLPLDETTLAEVLKTQGYATGAMGKWHLGRDKKYGPEHQGFDVYVEGQNAKERTDPNAGGKDTKELTDAALNFITEKKSSPFFVYLPYYAVHTPLQARQTDIDYFKAKKATGEQQNPTYAGMIKELDENVGRVIDHLKKLNLEKNTLVIFTSDNGGLIGARNTEKQITSNLPYRAGKGGPYEGGVRIPAIFSWPGKIKPGTTSEEPIISMDLFNTLAAVAGATDVKTYDGANFLPVLTGAPYQKPLHAQLYWHYPHYHRGGSTMYSAVLEGNKRLVYHYETGQKEYFDLSTDISEQKDLYATHPKDAEALYRKLQTWLTQSNAQLPSPNPTYDEAKKNVQAKGKED